MSQEGISTSAPPKLGSTIKGIRTRLGMNMTEFAQAVGITQGQISRYEADRAVPGVVTMAALLNLADGAEKNPILERLTGMLCLGPMTEAEVLSTVKAHRKRLDAMWVAAMRSWRPTEAPPPFWANILGIAPNLARLVELVSVLYERRREVDASLVRVVQLWCDHQSSDPVVRQCFADVAQYLEFLLKAKATQPEESGTSMARGAGGRRKKLA